MELGQNQVEALDLWRRVTVTTVRSDAPDLTARQMAVLMTVRLQPAPHTVRGLAATRNVGKPAITRALDTLSRLGFVQRRRDPGGHRQAPGPGPAWRRGLGPASRYRHKVIALACRGSEEPHAAPFCRAHCVAEPA